MIAVENNLLGIGLYTASEAAFYARIQTRTLNRWLYGDSQGEPVIDPQRGRSVRDVSFLDFVQALAIRAITTGPKPGRIPLPKIREAVEEAKQQYGVPYPFAMEHITFLLGDTVIIRLKDYDYRPLTGTTKGNRLLTEVVEVCKKNLKFGPAGIAEQITAWGSGDQTIIMNPRLRFGEPTFPSYGYTAQTLWESTASEGSIVAASRAYGVPEDVIAAACEYWDHLQGRAAA